MEGGFWREGPGVVAYAFPTYDGSGIKRDAPSARWSASPPPPSARGTAQAW